MPVYEAQRISEAIEKAAAMIAEALKELAAAIAKGKE